MRGRDFGIFAASGSEVRWDVYMVMLGGIVGWSGEAWDVVKI